MGFLLTIVLLVDSVWSLWRAPTLGREAGSPSERAQNEKWNLIAVDLGLDASTSNGKLIWNILASVAEWELDSRRASWAVSVAGAVEDGKHVGPLPRGYRRQDEVSPHAPPSQR